jgi:hypothetical protein
MSRPVAPLPNAFRLKRAGRNPLPIPAIAPRLTHLGRCAAIRSPNPFPTQRQKGLSRNQRVFGAHGVESHVLCSVGYHPAHSACSALAWAGRSVIGHDAQRDDTQRSTCLPEMTHSDAISQRWSCVCRISLRHNRICQCDASFRPQVGVGPASPPADPGGLVNRLRAATTS